MPQRLAALLALAGFGLLVVAGLAWRPAAPAATDRVSFQIATGGSGGVFFAIGQAVAGLISHPPGVGRCDTSTVCGPAGVILSTRTSTGSIDSLRAVDAGQVDSAFVRGDVLADGVAGTGAFRRGGRLRHVRVIAALFAEPVQLVAAPASGIAGVADLRGKRVALEDASGSDALARAILAAWRLPLSSLKRGDADDPVQALAAGRIDAFFLVSGVPVAAVRDLLAAGKARLVPVAGPGLDRLARAQPQLHAMTIAAGAYPRTAAVDTVATRAFWVTSDRASDALVYGLTRALFNPANRAALSLSHPAALEIGTGTAALDPPAPLHPGAARYYREIAVLR